MIYLDNSATTKPFPEVLETYKTVAETYFANPSSIHEKGGEAERLLMRAHQVAADLLRVSAKEIVFTSGGSEGNNLAVKGTALYYRSRGKHLITTEVEHASTYEAFKQMERLGFEVTWLPADQDGRVSVNDLEKAIRPDTILVSMIHVNNELGTIQPIAEAGNLLREFPTIQFHVDHVQGAAKVPLDMKAAGIDLCTLSAHKFHGPRGTGILYVREGVNLMPLISGGEHEGGFRAGTENLPAIVAMTKALRLSFDSAETGIAKMQQLQSQLRSVLQGIKEITINTPEGHVAPHIVNFSISNKKPEVLIHSLEQKDIYVSTKSACSSKEGGASRVLLAAGIPEERANSALRISLSFANSEQDITETAEALRETLSKRRRMEGSH